MNVAALPKTVNMKEGSSEFFITEVIQSNLCFRISSLCHCFKTQRSVLSYSKEKIMFQRKQMKRMCRSLFKISTFHIDIDIIMIPNVKENFGEVVIFIFAFSDLLCASISGQRDFFRN